jgi:hypothetical protein
MPPITNTFTVQIADAHTHTVSQSGIAAASKLDAVLACAQTWQDNPNLLAGFTLTDTFTLTITQP